MNRNDALHRALSSLSPRQRFVIENSWGLDGGEPLSIRQIADLMGIRHRAVQKCYAAAMKKLREGVASYPLVVEGSFPEGDRSGRILSGQVAYSDLESDEQYAVDQWLGGFDSWEDDYSEDSLP